MMRYSPAKQTASALRTIFYHFNDALNHAADLRDIKCMVSGARWMTRLNSDDDIYLSYLRETLNDMEFAL